LVSDPRERNDSQGDAECIRVTYAVENEISVAKLEPPERHCHPTFDIGGEENKGSVLDNHF
jgi:hypothetical protein